MPQLKQSRQLTTIITILVAALALGGCRQLDVGAVLTYEVDADAAPDGVAVDMPALVAAINDRLQIAGDARAVDGSRIVVEVYGHQTEEELSAIKHVIGARGLLEFRIMASPVVDRHEPIIEAARQLPVDQTIVRLDDADVARWVECDEREFRNTVQTGSNGLVFRMADKTRQALVMTNDGLDVTGEYLRSVAEDVDESGRPQIRFEFDAQGASLFGKLTGDHVPTASGTKHRLGVLIDGRLLSAPSIESKIANRGRISGGSMTARDLKAIVAILNAGVLPCPVKLVAEELRGE